MISLTEIKPESTPRISFHSKDPPKEATGTEKAHDAHKPPCTHVPTGIRAQRQGKGYKASIKWGSDGVMHTLERASESSSQLGSCRSQVSTEVVI